MNWYGFLTGLGVIFGALVVLAVMIYIALDVTFGIDP